MGCAENLGADYARLGGVKLCVEEVVHGGRIGVEVRKHDEVIEKQQMYELTRAFMFAYLKVLEGTVCE